MFSASNPVETAEAEFLVPHRFWENGMSISGSILLHLCLLGLLAACVLPGEKQTSAGISVTLLPDTLVDGESGGFDGLGDSVQFTADFNSEPNAGGLGDSPRADLPLEASLSSSAMILADLDVSLANSIGDIGSGGLAESITGIPSAGGSGKGTKKGTGQGRASGSGKGTGTGKGNGSGRGKSGFFGLNIKDKSVVFVVDASRSMNLPHPGPMRTRFNRVKFELIQTINSMTDKEKFFIIFFADGALPMPADHMVDAEPQAKRRYLNWMARITATGPDTLPERALIGAISLKPDMIYFLTDGAFAYSVVQTVTAANPNGIPIHTIGFSDNRGENQLMEIAQRNNGDYTYISAEEDEEESADEGTAAASIISVLGN